MDDSGLLNPIKRYRLELGYSSPNHFAQEAGIRLAAVGQAEQGFYTDPPPSILRALGIQEGTSEEVHLIELYHFYQKKKRAYYGPQGKCRLVLDPKFETSVNPLKAWRTQSRLSTYGLCSFYCLHLPTVNKFERAIETFPTIPNNLRVALIDAGFDLIDGLLEEFSEAFSLNRFYVKNTQRRVNNLPEVKLAV
jgi:hypothetical protein